MIFTWNKTKKINIFEVKPYIFINEYSLNLIIFSFMKQICAIINYYQFSSLCECYLELYLFPIRIFKTIPVKTHHSSSSEIICFILYKCDLLLYNVIDIFESRISLEQLLQKRSLSILCQAFNHQLCIRNNFSEHSLSLSLLKYRHILTILSHLHQFVNQLLLLFN